MDHCWISKRQKHWYLCMTDLFTRRRDKVSCPWTKQSNSGKCSNRKLCTSALVNDGTLRGTSDFASALSNANNVKISDLLECLVMLLFSSFFFTRKSFAESCKIINTSMGETLFDKLKQSLVEVSFHFHR